MDTVKYLDTDEAWAAACAKARARMPKAKPLTPQRGERVVIVYPKLYDLLGLTEAQKQEYAARAARLFMRDFANERTPDGAQYNHLSVKLALAGLE